MLADELCKAQQLNSRIRTLLDGKYSTDTKTTLILAYLNVALDHHGAMILLMRSAMYGSALALVRLVFEAMIRAHWVLGCATIEHAEWIAQNDDFRFPNMSDMTRAVDAAFTAPGEASLTFFQQVRDDTWNAMNSYTHAGLLQLASQFNGEFVEANYSEEALKTGLVASNASVLLFGVMVARGSNRNSAADELEGLFGQ